MLQNNPNPVILLLAKLQNSPNPVILLLAKNLNSPNPVIRDYDYLLGLHTHLSIGINFSHSTPPPQTSQSSKSWRATSISSSSSSSAIISLLSNVAKDGRESRRLLRSRSAAIAKCRQNELSQFSLSVEKVIVNFVSRTLHISSKSYRQFSINHPSRLAFVVIASWWLCSSAFDGSKLLIHLRGGRLLMFFIDILYV